ncbi:MAG TPA: Lrp/AsnC family transcriptional regulator [Chryseosolibacter sp.]|nr:Lrp/AsnC family transcriptional regulator [Chryseosolibacter sp.]
MKRSINEKFKRETALDEIDFGILSFLQQDGRVSFTVIAEKLKVSIGTVRTRFNRLIDDGTINIVGRVIPEKVGFNAYAHIAVYVRPASLKEKVANRIARLPEVSFLASTSGDYDLEVDVMCRDNDHLLEFIDRLSSIPGVNQTKSTIYFKVYKYAQPDLAMLKGKM